jgi:hypothetical protein
MRDIATAWPQPIAVAELAKRFRARTNIAANGDAVPQRLAEILFGAYGAGIVELHSHVPRLPEHPGVSPAASPLARALLVRGDRVVNRWHEEILLDEALGRRLLQLLDGTRDRAALLAALGASLRASPGEEASALLERYLEHFLRLALLID